MSSKDFFQSDENVLYLNCGYGYTNVYICQNSNYILKVSVLYWILIIYRWFLKSIYTIYKLYKPFY